ncbi:PAS domain S-box protein [bacterium]|nr:PAS domain S-box protein [bacterium]
MSSNWIDSFCSAQQFMPHGHCYLWNPGLVMLHGLSDLMIALAYTSIPLTLLKFVRLRKDIPFNWMFLCFGLFIVACGSTHWMEIYTLWYPSYWAAGVLKAITAVASVLTAILLIRLLPKALQLPTLEQWRQANAALEARVEERTRELTLRNQELAHQVAERTRVEMALRESEALKSAVMAAALDGIVLMDQEGKIRDFNPAAELTFGYSRAEVLGRPLSEVLIPPSLRRQHEQGLANYGMTGVGRVLGRRVELTALHRDGSEFPAEVAVVRIRAEGGAMFTGYIRDISERRRAAEAEGLRRAKEAAEEANAELESFSYSVAHDLRAPLRAISGFSSELLADWGERLDESARKDLNRIVAAAGRMAELIDDLLLLSRVARSEVRRETVDLSEMARKIASHLHESAPERAVEWLVAEQLVADCDPQLMRALLENLLGNAWKFTSKQRSARIEFGQTVQSGVIVYFVGDNGAGFNMEYASNLFTPFRRLHSAEEFEGTGIGLATVERIIRRHGGKVWAESAENGGATFYFSLAPLEERGSAS